MKEFLTTESTEHTEENTIPLLVFTCCGKTRQVLFSVCSVLSVVKKKIMKKTEELQFLPAALEIQQSPPLPASRWILWLIILFFVIFITWACVGEVDIVSVAHGKIVPNGRVKIVQPIGMGVVKAIHVEEGQSVNAGDLLIELDSTQTEADVERLQQEKQALEVNRSQLKAIFQGLQFKCKSFAQCQIPVFDCDPLESACQLNQQYIEQTLNEFYARRQSLYDELNKKQAEYRSIKQRISLYDATLPLITERAEALAELSRKKLGSKLNWLELEQERIEQEKHRAIESSNLGAAEAAISNLEQRTKALQAEYERNTLAELLEVGNRLELFGQEITKAKQLNQFQSLIAPITGTVQQLAIHTIGGVVTHAQELMKIVPTENVLEVEAWLQNKDIGFVKDGQSAEIKIETFPFTKYGTITGMIKKVSNDAVPNEQLGLVYLAQVTMDRASLWVNDKLINVSSGMAVTVEVKLGKRRIIEYLLTPLMKYRHESIRER